jgi:Ca-activated chloride channel family protein
MLAAGATLMVGMPLVGLAQQPEPRPTFRAAVDRVPVAATVRDRRGRPVTTLKAEDFQLLDNGQPQRILEFGRDAAPISLAILADVSGSMEVANKRAAARDAAKQLLAWLTPADRVGLYAFDAELTEVEPLQSAPGQVLARLESLAPWGRTSLFDAIADTGRRLAKTGAPRRAVIVLTDGEDNASQLTPGEVSGIASSIDVPVYVLVIVSPLDRVGQSETTVIDPRLAEQRDGALGNLARWTGGDIVTPVSPGDLAGMTRQIVDELHQQYLLAFEPSREPGWHPLELRTRRTNLVVRARSGYVVAGRPADHQ